MLNLFHEFSQVCSRKDQPADAIGHFQFVKIDEQPERHLEQFHVAQELRLVNRQNLFHGLRLHDYATVDQKVKTKRFLTVKPFILDQN